MSRYVLSAAADKDIEEIAAASLARWGVVRAERYILALHATFGSLAQFPEMGADVGHVRPGLMRLAAASHSIFYRKTDYGILIVRVLHQRMDFMRHF